MIYLDNAATSWPKPESVYRAMDDFARNRAGNPGRSGHPLARAAEDAIVDARRRAAWLLNAEAPERIVFTLNASDALNIAIKGFLREGDHVITSHTEHNSIRRPLLHMAKEGYIALDHARSDTSGIVPPDEIELLLRKETRLVAITHCSNVLGQVNPVADYAKITSRHGARILVDASQTAGVVPIDVRAMDLDMVAFPGHKNCFGPMGTGVLYVRDGIWLSHFREGATGVRSEEELHAEEMPARLECGTPNAHGISGLGAGLAFVEEKGVEAIGKHERELALAFIGRLREIPNVRVYSGKVPAAQIGPVSIRIGDLKPAEAAAKLDQKFGIACRPGLHCNPGTHKHLGTYPDGTVRFSFGCFNTTQDVDAAAAAVREISEGRA